MTKIKVKQIRSAIGKTTRQKNILKALGLKGIGFTKEHLKSQSIQGMLNKVSHLIEIENY